MGTRSLAALFGTVAEEHTLARDADDVAISAHARRSLEALDGSIDALRGAETDGVALVKFGARRRASMQS